MVSVNVLGYCGRKANNLRYADGKHHYIYESNGKYLF